MTCRRSFALLLVPLLLALGGCIPLYRMDIQQGNVVTQEMIDTLKPSMTRAQVRFVLGTPLITDPFHPERWDYFYSYRKGVTLDAERRRLTVVFDGDRLVRLEGDVVPAGMERFDERAQETRPPTLLGPPFPEQAKPAAPPAAASEKVEAAPSKPFRSL